MAEDKRFRTWRQHNGDVGKTPDSHRRGVIKRIRGAAKKRNAAAAERALRRQERGHWK